jgi:hypothetical protein
MIVANYVEGLVSSSLGKNMFVTVFDQGTQIGVNKLQSHFWNGRHS